MFILLFLFFFFNDPATPEFYTLSLHDALPISLGRAGHARRFRPGERRRVADPRGAAFPRRLASHLRPRSEEHTSELQSRLHLVCRLLLEKKKKKTTKSNNTQQTQSKTTQS